MSRESFLPQKVLQSWLLKDMQGRRLRCLALYLDDLSFSMLLLPMTFAFCRTNMSVFSGHLLDVREYPPVPRPNTPG